jgi:hypothetical protein
MIQVESHLVVSSKPRLTIAIAIAIAIVTGLVSASCASGIAAASRRPALATTTVCKNGFDPRMLHLASDKVHERNNEKSRGDHGEPSGDGARHAATK